MGFCFEFNLPEKGDRRILVKIRWMTAIFSVTIVLFFTAHVGLQAASQDYDEEYQRTFPNLHITTELDPFVQEREFWHEGTVSLTGMPAEFVFNDVPARIRGRGNSTWWNGPDKRPLRIRFNGAQPMLGSESVARDWILLANHFDRSLLRNYAALYFGNTLEGLKFTPVPHHVHLYVNGEYMGVYLLTDERDVNPGRMQLRWDEDPAISCYFLELDARAYVDAELDEDFIDINGLLYDLRWPGNLSPEHVDYIKDYLYRVSYAIRRQSFDDILALIDLDSFVDFYIVQEFFKDVDARDLSIFMYITGTGDERRLYKGPIWDFDLAAGNAGHQPMGPGPEGLYVAVFNYWYRYLMNRPEFFDAVQTRWNEIRENEVAQTIERVRYVATSYQDEFERNFERHPDVFGRAQMPSPPELLEIDYFMGHVEHLLNWLETRANWLDDFLNGRLVDYDPMWALVEYQASTSPIQVSFNGELHDFSVTPISMHNRIMVTIQELETIFGFDIDYGLTPTGAIAMQYGNTSITHQAGDLFIMVNGVRVDFAMPTAVIIREYIFVPLRVFVEALGYELGWEPETRTVIINLSD